MFAPRFLKPKPEVVKEETVEVKPKKTKVVKEETKPKAKKVKVVKEEVKPKAKKSLKDKVIIIKDDTSSDEEEVKETKPKVKKVQKKKEEKVEEESEDEKPIIVAKKPTKVEVVKEDSDNEVKEEVVKEKKKRGPRNQSSIAKAGYSVSVKNVIQEENARKEALLKAIKETGLAKVKVDLGRLSRVNAKRQNIKEAVDKDLEYLKTIPLENEIKQTE